LTTQYHFNALQSAVLYPFGQFKLTIFSYGTFLQETSVLEAALIGTKHTSDQPDGLI